MVRLATSLVALALGAVSTFGNPLASSGMDLKRSEALASLSPGVRAYLETLDPRDYELDIPNEAELERRQVTKDSGVIYNCKKGRVAVTYDDGPFTWHSSLSKKWADAGMQVSFFVNGNNFGCAYDKPYVSYLRQSLAAGHLLASHTWSHPHLNTLTDAQIDEQVNLVETMLLKTVGVVPRYIRAPYGEADARVVARLQSKHGLTVVNWSDDIGDADGVSTAVQKSTYNSYKKGERHLILSHETHKASAGSVANTAIARFEAQGIKSQTVHDCIGGTGSPYKVVAKAPGSRDASWTCAGTPAPGA